MNPQHRFHPFNTLSLLFPPLAKTFLLARKNNSPYTRLILRNLNPPEESLFKLRRIAKLSVLKPLLLSPKLLRLQITSAQQHKAPKEITPRQGFCRPLRHLLKRPQLNSQPGNQHKSHAIRKPFVRSLLYALHLLTQ